MTIRRQGMPDALGLMEEATHVLAKLRSGAWAAYFAGSIPFYLGFLFFWADMSRGASAFRYSSVASLGMACLYIWMKCWHAVFGSLIRAELSGRPSPPPTARRIWGLIMGQTLIQPWAAPAIVLTFAILPWLGPAVFGFFVTACIRGYDEATDIGELRAHAKSLGGLWPGQGAVLIAWWFLLFFVIILATGTNLIVIAILAKMFTGAENLLSFAGVAALNSTFLSIAVVLALFCVDPVLKALYVLRAYYGESVETGEDIRRQIRAYKAASLLGLFLIVAPACLALDPGPQKTINAEELDQSIEQVMQRPHFSWKMAKVKTAKEEVKNRGPISRFLIWVAGGIKKGVRTVASWIRKFAVWLEKIMNRWTPQRSPPNSEGNMFTTQTLLFIALSITACLLALLLWRNWKKRKSPVATADAFIEPNQPDLEDESTTAAELPSEGWLRMARDMMAKGNRRLALRALYFASLATLAQSNLLSLSDAKTEHEYVTELSRRAHQNFELHKIFRSKVELFEMAWYGMHPVSEALFNRFKNLHQQIASHVQVRQG